MLSRLASAVGKPLYSDRATTSKSRVLFARVCVEVSASASLPDIIWIKEDDDIPELAVEYEWKPFPCKMCCTFGHSEEQCGVKSANSKMMQARNTKNPAGRAEKTKSNTGNCGPSRQGAGVRQYVPVNKGAQKLAGSGFTKAPHLSNSFAALETISETQNGNLKTIPRVPTSEVVSVGVPEPNENVIVQVENESQDETLEMNVSTEEAHDTPKGEIACTQITNGPICLQEESMEGTLKK
ncbi:hypothetical protein QJS10_CPA09g00783 [Acorus calamus]|uniref:Zinc knuckle CX2CX4HX4C domain-containing protein n=1 Tax=Acorus calamus TaxID=4465 RepID=A0AAV9E541_ACOCL|nr:hypothetical protein QJS10_CPA09g00783 [Acorus calamus]